MKYFSHLVALTLVGSFFLLSCASKNDTKRSSSRQVSNTTDETSYENRFLQTQPDPYPAYALRTDLGEVLQKDETEDVRKSSAAIEKVIIKRMKEQGQKGRGDHSAGHGCYPAQFRVKENLNAQLGQGIASPARQGKTMEAVVRFSNGDTPDVPDLRSVSMGLAVKVYLDSRQGPRTNDSEYMLSQENPGLHEQDFLTATGPTFMVKDIHDYSWLFSKRADPSLKDFIALGAKHPSIIVNRLVKPALRDEDSAPIYLDQRFWGRLPAVWGNRVGKVSFKPCAPSVAKPPGAKTEELRYQTDLIKEHLGKADICYKVLVQLRPTEIDSKLGASNSTLIDQYFPIENAQVRWPDEETKQNINLKNRRYAISAPYEEIGQLTVKRQSSPLEAEQCEKTVFNPWNGLKDHQPMSSLSRARLFVYKKSKEVRYKIYNSGDKTDGKERYTYHGGLTDFAETVADPESLETATMLGRRYNNMVKNNLLDTGLDSTNSFDCAELMKSPHRTADGNCYLYQSSEFINQPGGRNTVGARTARFGRNSRPPTAENVKKAVNNLLVPNPRVISRELFSRKDGKTIEVPSLNLLAAAWLQAENHDWFSHGKNVTPESGKSSVEKHGEQYKAYFDYIQVPPVPGDSEFPNGIKIPRSRPDLTSTDRHNFPVTFRNVVTHWWDASQIYGSDEATILKVRTNPNTGQKYEDGLIAVDETNRRLYYENGIPITGFTDNWWVGLEMFHSLFAMEHNSVARMLKEKHPQMSGDEIFEKSRLTVAALIAKIHTVEWTPALLDNKLTHIGMWANWYGIKKIKDPKWMSIVEGLSKNFAETLNGLVGAKVPNLHKVPFTLTEEFVSVYRMHPLIPDQLHLRALGDSEPRSHIAIKDTTFEKTASMVAKGGNTTRDLMYTFLTNHPGALTLNNFPQFMQSIDVQRNTEGMPSIHMDLGTIDIVRDRERLVPRYNEFRRQLGLKPIKTFKDLTKDKEVVAQLEKVYGNDVEALDLQIGSLAENDRLEGFAFGVTPFSIFQLMASRRLMADPFFTNLYTPEVYSQEGLDWIDHNTMIDVITRHYPELKPRLINVVNAFHPWQ